MATMPANPNFKEQRSTITRVFKKLRTAKGGRFFAKQNHSFDQCGGWADAPNVDNIVFYTYQDLQYLKLDGEVCLAWQGDAQKIVKAFEEEGVDVNWDGSRNMRIVLNFNTVYKQHGKLKYTSEDTITVRGDLPYVLEIEYELNDELRSIVQAEDDYWRNGQYRFQIREDYQKLKVTAGRIEKTEDGKYAAHIHECIIHPTEHDKEWLKSNPFPLDA